MQNPGRFTEVIRRDVAAQLGLANHRSKELISDVSVEEALAVLGERRRIERCGVDRQVEEPFEQHVVVESFAERPLRTHRVHRHQHRCFQQHLRRNRGPAPGRVHRFEGAIEIGQHRVDHDTDPTDRMISRDQILGAQRRQHRQLPLRGSTHAPILLHPLRKREHQPEVFQHPASGVALK